MRTNKIFDHISLSSSQNEKCFRQNLQRTLKRTFCVQYTLFSKIVPFYEIMFKNIVQSDRSQMKIQIVHAPFCMLYDKGYMYTLRICKTYCVSTATVDTRTRYNVNLYVHCLPCHSRFSTSMTQCKLLRSRCQSKMHECRKILLSSEDFRHGLPICSTSNDRLS